jgi:hypothetical protein
MNIMSDYRRKTLPYTTSTGVKIGLFYIPPSEYEQDADARALQLALINKNSKPTIWQRLFSTQVTS